MPCGSLGYRLIQKQSYTKQSNLDIMVELTLAVAFIGGLISFFSPCIIPLIPAYISHLSGTSVMELQKRKSKGLQLRVFTNAIFFVLGFTLLFMAIGLSIGYVSEIFPQFNIWLARIGGAIIIAFGLHTLGILKIPFLETERRLHVQVASKNYLSSATLGAAFGIGWSPCVGPILASILVLAGSSASALTGGSLLVAYSIGLAIPFLITGLFTSAVSKFIQQANKYFGVVNIIAGILLIGLGIIVFTNNFSRVLALFVELTGIRSPI